MADRNSQNVRLKEEVIAALAHYVRPRGATQQHVVSVGTWFYMCLPDQLTRAIGEAFYEWCKTRPGQAMIPNEIAPLLARVIRILNDECAREADRVETADGLTLADLIDAAPPAPERDVRQAADAAAAVAETKLRGRRRARRNKSAGSGEQNH